MSPPRLTVVLDGESQLEYDRAATLAEDQFRYLERMDERMDQGIELDGGTLNAPDPLQRARFVAQQLMQAVQAGNEGLAAATCTWLAVRVPELRQVRAVRRDDGLAIDLVFDRDYAPELKLNFVRPDAFRN